MSNAIPPEDLLVEATLGSPSAAATATDLPMPPAEWADLPDAGRARTRRSCWRECKARPTTTASAAPRTRCSADSVVSRA